MLRPFGKSSFWTQPLPTTTPRHPSSDAFVGQIIDQMRRYYGAAAVNTTRYTAPLYVVGPDQPLITAKYSNCQLKGWTDAKFVAQLERVPLPDFARPAAGNDAEMAIYQPSSDCIWEFWKAEKRTDGWYACWGGRLPNASTSNGIFPYPYGVTATGLSLLGGVMQIEELRLGRIDHVIDFAIPESRKSIFSWPANRTDGKVDSPTAIPQGLRFRLDPTLNVDLLTLHPIAKAIARAVQKYGMILRDTSGTVSFYAENPLPITLSGQPDPYPSIFAGRPSYSIMNGFPWSWLRALPLNYGKPV